MSEHITARYEIIKTENGNIYKFFCDLCGAVVCATKAYNFDNLDNELISAWINEGERYFNKCHKCGKWVMEMMYNADVLECVDCAPWEDAPKYCKSCGATVAKDEDICIQCNKPLRYQGGL